MQFLYLFICFLEKKIIYWEQYNIKRTYCTEFYLKKEKSQLKIAIGKFTLIYKFHVSMQ